MIPLFFGFDPREEVGAHTFVSSVIHHASEPVAFTPLHLPMLSEYDGGQRDGTNAFIYSRFLVPHLMGYKGWAIFVDGCDMVCKGDIAELWALRKDRYAVMVVKHDYKTKHPRKYVGTAMEADNADYPCKNHSSVMLINCEHPGWRDITPEKVATMSGAQLHRFTFLRPDEVGELPAEWNWLPQEHGCNERSKIVHYSIGIPAFPSYSDTEMADSWFEAHARVNHAIR